MKTRISRLHANEFINTTEASDVLCAFESSLRAFSVRRALCEKWKFIRFNEKAERSEAQISSRPLLLFVFVVLSEIIGKTIKLKKCIATLSTTLKAQPTLQVVRFDLHTGGARWNFSGLVRVPIMFRLHASAFSKRFS